MADAFYLPGREPATFSATDACGGPWDPRMSHGGPLGALLARAVERTPASRPFTIVRIAVEILGPVPLGEVRVSAGVARTGRSVELVEAELVAGGRPAVRARAWRIRAAELDLPAAPATPPERPPLPEADSPDPEGWPGGFLRAMQFRFVSGGWSEPGPATCWARMRLPLVAGEQPSGLQRLLVLADCGNGVSNALPIDRWVFINPDLTVHLSRSPSGDWLCLQARTSTSREGFGLATSTLYDESGVVGHAAQSLFVSPRS